LATQRVQFGDWIPDQPTIAGGMADVNNVIPQAVGYGAIASAVDLSNSAGEDLTSVFAGKFNTTTQLFAGGDTKLFLYDGATKNLNNVSKSGNYTGAGTWRFAQFGNVVLAVNNVNKVQAWTVGSSSNFADVDTNAPVAKFITVVRDFVVTANLDGGTNANKVQWSDINDETTWVSGTTSQSDYQIVPDGGNITGITGGEFGLIFLERAVVRMSYIGSPLFFQFDTISRGLGCMSTGSVAQYGNISYFLGDDGFYSCDGNSVRGIGTEKIDRYFFKNANLNAFDSISSAVDPIKNIVVWNYPNVQGGRSLLIYNWQLDKWSKADSTSVDYISSLATSGITLEGLDTYGTIDTLTSSLDSREWVGGKLLFGGVDGQKIVTFTGSNMTATLTTGDLEVGFNSCANLVRPQVQDGSSTVKIASRKELDDIITFGASVTTSAEGRAGVRSFGRYHRVQVTPTGNWTHAIGVDVDIVQRGLR
jgi:hypothetical protein